MFSKNETSQIRKEFWTAFGQYMRPVPSFEGEKINWLNYKTGEKSVLFRMNAYNNTAIVEIQINHADETLQQLYFDQFVELRLMLNTTLNAEWIWQLHTQDENGKTISRIYRKLDGVSIFNKGDWAQLISFFKAHIIALANFGLLPGMPSKYYGKSCKDNNFLERTATGRNEFFTDFAIKLFLCVCLIPKQARYCIVDYQSSLSLLQKLINCCMLAQLSLLQFNSLIVL